MPTDSSISACHFALLPAAGHGVRLGGGKLLLPLGGRPLILHTLSAWQKSRVDRVLVVVRPGDDSLAAIARQAGAEIVVPDFSPPDMKASVQAALRYINQKYAPPPTAGFLVAPADMPQLSPRIVDRLIERQEHDSAGRIHVPVLNEVRGHPVLFPWSLAAEVFALGRGEGLNAIVDRCPTQLTPCEDLVAPGEYPFADVDTPEQYQRLVEP